MRASRWFGLVFVAALGCGGGKTELPSKDVEAPKTVKGVGAGSESGLPKPPDAITKP
jgi:hypothetical protein